MSRICEENGCPETEDLYPHPSEAPGTGYWICHDHLATMAEKDRCDECGGAGFFDQFNPVSGHGTRVCRACDGTGEA